MYILNYSCITAAGTGTAALMTALYAGRDCSQANEATADATVASGRVCSIPPQSEKKISYQATIQNYWQQLWNVIHPALSAKTQQELKKARVGLIFASTKGFIEDFIWQADSEYIRQQQDPFNQLIVDFCESHPEVPWQLSCNISNACSSSHVALEYIQDLFTADRLDYVLLVAADLIGPFVFKGFHSLKLLSATTNRPFSADRDGLQLGEAVTMMLLSKDKKSDASLRIAAVASDTEGSSITRPSMNGEGLARAMEKLHTKNSTRNQITPDLVITHGTGTKFNDLAEDLALQRFLGALQKTETPITNTKWSIGHTLGASGCVDLIAGCEILKNQRAFKIQNTAEKDPLLQMNYLTSNSTLDDSLSYRQILISSLGFGGVHAALLVTRLGTTEETL